MGIAANLVGRCYLGIECEQTFVDISRNRRIEIDNSKTYIDYRSKIKDISSSEDYETSCFACDDVPFYDLPF